MISQVAEVTAVTELLNTTLDELAVSGEATPRPPLGIMVEVPGVLPLLPHLIDQLDFISVGTNDLTQYLLAVDRGNVRVASRYDSLHPGVLHSLVDIIKMCKRLKLDVSVCGEMAGDTVSVVLLVAMGFGSLSMSAASLPRIRRLIRSISMARAQELLAHALAMQDAVEIRMLIQEALVDEGLAFLLNRKNIEV
jgi:phosphotransferase system enzyme I (PtsP)